LLCADPITFPSDCSSAGTYPQGGVYSGAPPVYTPGYSQDFGDPCGTDWLDSNCKLWACTSPGCSCDDCGTCNVCCDCSFGVPSPPGCIDHTLKCSVPSNTTLSIT
jgi:hypothetical protein